MTGCIVLLGFVLYPYVYLHDRAMFLMQAANLIDVARTLGHEPQRRCSSASRCRWRVPPIAVGLTLALLEALNDIGAVGVSGRPHAHRVDLLHVGDAIGPGGRGADRARHAGDGAAARGPGAGAPRAAAVRQRRAASASAASLTACRGWKSAAALATCLIPIAIGFVIPAAYLVDESLRAYAFRRHLHARL